LPAVTALADPLVAESFDYSAGPIDGKNGGTGFTAAWSDYSGSGEVTSDGRLKVTIPSDSHHVSPPRRSFAGSVPLMADGDSLYLSYVLITGGTVPVQSTWMFGTRGAQQQFWYFGFGDPGTPVFGVAGAMSTMAVAPNTTYQLVARMTRDDVGGDRFTMWVDPLGESSTPVVTHTTTAFIHPGQTTITDWSANQSGYGTLFIDDIRIGKTFGDVVPPEVIPEPASCALLLAGLIGAWLVRRRQS
jgi:hypothetical protein